MKPIKPILNSILNLEDILEIELELTGTCNLSCPLCTRNYSHANHQLQKNIRPLKDIIKQLDSFPNLKHINIAGTVSEPTLYRDIIYLVEYLIERNPEMEIDFYSNASILNPVLWEKLGKLFQHKNQRMIFTICGSTQDLHEKYRKGSKLVTVLRNARSFRKFSSCDYLQYIIFQYNLADVESQETKAIMESFSNSFFIESEGRRLLNEYNNAFSKDIYPQEKRAELIDALFKRGEILYKRKQLNVVPEKICIDCISLKQKRIYIDQFGQIFACYNQAEYYPESTFTFHSNPNISQFNFTKIKEFGYKDCLKCEKNIQKLIDDFGLEFIC